jgi:hypothetical protein
MSITTLLDQLPRVRQTAPLRWASGCPLHGSKGRPVSIRELDDGRILLHDFGGCSTSDVLAALGLGMKDLFPDGVRGNFKPSRHRVSAHDLLEVIGEEADVVAVVGADMVDRKSIDDVSWARLAKAVSRISRARDHIHGR